MKYISSSLRRTSCRYVRAWTRCSTTQECIDNQTNNHQADLRLGLLSLLLLRCLLFVIISIGVDLLDGRIPLRSGSAASPGTLLRLLFLFLGCCSLFGRSLLLRVCLVFALFFVRLFVGLLPHVSFGLLRACGRLLLISVISCLVVLGRGLFGLLLLGLLLAVRFGFWRAFLWLVFAASLVLVATTLLLVLLGDFSSLCASV